MLDYMMGIMESSITRNRNKDIEKYVEKELSKLVKDSKKFEVRINVGDNTYSIEFFAFIDGKRYQCYDMIDDGIIKEKDFDICSKKIADYIRDSSEYKQGKINKFKFNI